MPNFYWRFLLLAIIFLQMLFTFYISAKIHHVFHQFCFEYVSICSRIAVQRVCRIRFHVTLFYDVPFSLVKSHSLSDWNPRMLVELFFSRTFHERKDCHKKKWDFLLRIKPFSLRKVQYQKCNFFRVLYNRWLWVFRETMQTWVDSLIKPRSKFQNANVDEDCHSKRNANVNFRFLFWLSMET